ncbi:MAG: hypothetical protein K8I82_28600 [Anaerolineae bacterium]|nr:hypothetical protein [Anaerolineae bacterium]
MSQLKLIYPLLREEYAVSRHIFWLDEESGKLVNDIMYTMHLLVKTARCLRRGDQDCWKELVAYCIERAMSAALMQAIGAYLSNCGQLEALPAIDLTEPKHRNWRGTTVPLLDETDRLACIAPTEKPEPDRPLVLKSACQWSQQDLRLRDTNPHHARKNQTKATHWLL